MQEWGNGTAEYALSAIQCARDGKAFECPVPQHEHLPMVYIDDLVRGMVSLMDADIHDLREPQKGYTLTGFSFSPDMLFSHIRRFAPDLKGLGNACIR